MSETGKDSLIMQLYSAYKGSHMVPDSRYSADTNTLYSNGKHGTAPALDPAATNTIEIVCEKKEFDEILCGRAHFAVILEKEAQLDREVRIRELKGLTPTGRYVIKKVTQIARSKDAAGIKDAYAVIGWE